MSALVQIGRRQNSCVMPSVADATALRSRAEVQLLSVLNKKNTQLASSHLKAEQQMAQAEDEKSSKHAIDQSGLFEALPPSSEEARVVAEVRQLKDDFIAGVADNQKRHDSNGEPSQIELNAVQRRDRHMQMQTEYTAEVKAISEDVEVAIIKTADYVKDVLATIDGKIRRAELALKNDELLLKADNDTVLDMWRDLDKVCQQRSEEITQFTVQLDHIEQTRTQRVRVGLQHLTAALMEIAYALPPEVERIIEAEAHEMNMVVICNRRVYADLEAKMSAANVDVFLSARLAWEEGQIRWRHLRHRDAITKFQTTLNSPLFTDPEERQETLHQIRAFQSKIHQHRLAILQQLSDAGASLTSEQAKQILGGLSTTQQFEEEKSQAFFSDLLALHEAKIYAAKALQEALRLELHEVGALAKEGSIAEARTTFVKLFGDDAMEDFFRIAGGLKADLDMISKQLNIADLIYNSNLEPLMGSVALILGALPLESVMERQGKGAERKAVLATLEKIRKAAKSEIMSILPSLQAQVSMLLNIDGMSSVFKNELEVAKAQMETITQEYVQTNVSTAGLVPVVSSTRVSIDKLASRPPSIAPTSPNGTRKTSVLAGTASKNQPNDTLAGFVDLQAIRKVQRRVGSLLYASELSEPWQQLLRFIYDQLVLQTNANRVVDKVIAEECDSVLETRQQESRLLVDEMGKRMEKQSALLHEQVENFARFFLNVVLCLEESADKVQYVNLSALDLLDTLKEANEEVLAELESGFTQSCARLRHSPNDTVLRGEFQRSSDLLNNIEQEYRGYYKRVGLAADKNVIAMAMQRARYLRRLCDFFGLKLPNQPADESEFDLEQFLSVQNVEQELSQPPNSVEVKNDEKTTITYSPTSPNEDLSAPEEVFRSSSGLELTVAISLGSLARRIVAQHDDKNSGDEVVLDKTLLEGSLAGTDDKEFHDNGIDPEIAELETATVPLDGRALAVRRAVFDKVEIEFLSLDVPVDAVEAALARFRDAVLSKYDSDAAATAAQTDETRGERQDSSSALLEERLRIHWPRKGRLDVQFYQPRMGELECHRQRQERHLRGVWKKVDEQQKAFAAKAEQALAYTEQTRMAQVSFQAQLSLQHSLAALQGLEGRAKKNLSAFKSEGMEMLVALRTMTESDISSLLSSCQDYIRTCSSQLFPDLTSCEVISGCDYHPVEIAAIEEKIAAIEAQARQHIAEREEKVAVVGNRQGEVLGMWSPFKERYQACAQSLAMKEGLGQKFGLPRRAAQERYRSEMTRCETRSAEINALLSTLQTFADEDKGGGDSVVTADGHEFAKNVVCTLMQLRAKLYQRGMYFELLRYPAQLELIPVEYALAARGEDSNPQSIRDNEVVSEEDRAVATSFFAFADQVNAKCREETKTLYQQEGKMDELPPTGVPVALEEYLASQLVKARAFVVQQEASYREQVTAFARQLMLAPPTALYKFTAQSKRHMRRAIAGTTTSFEVKYQSWARLKSQHTLELRPQLCSPNNADLLRELQDRENARSTSAREALLQIRSHFLAEQIRLSLQFEGGLVGLFQSLVSLLESSVLSLDDLRPFSGEELSKLKRKSLKRLRKVARVNGFGDFREVKRSAADVIKLSQQGESPRFPLRAWTGIPAFGMQTFWEDLKTEIVSKDANDPDPLLQGLVCGPSVSLSNDGACAALLTPAHRALVRARDAAYSEYVCFCREETRLFLDKLQERLQDEAKWTTSWEQGVQTLRQQQQAL